MKTILVVDDEVFVRRIVSFKLTARGYHVIDAESGEAALELASSNRLDLVVTDHQMYGMTGVELAKQLFRDPLYASLPVLMISAREFEIGKGQLQNTNVKSVVAKPFSMSSVLKQVEKLIGPGERIDPQIEADLSGSVV